MSVGGRGLGLSRQRRQPGNHMLRDYEVGETEGGGGYDVI